MHDSFKKYIIFHIYLLIIFSNYKNMKYLTDIYCEKTIDFLNQNQNNDLSLAIKMLHNPNLELGANLDLPLSFNFREVNFNITWWKDLLQNIINSNNEEIRYNLIWLEKKLNLNLMIHRNTLLDFNILEDQDIENFVLFLSEEIIEFKNSQLLKLSFLFLKNYNMLRRNFEV